MGLPRLFSNIMYIKVWPEIENNERELQQLSTTTKMGQETDINHPLKRLVQLI